MRRSARVTALFLSVVLAASIAPVGAQAAAPTPTEAPAAIDLGDDIVYVPGASLARPTAASKPYGTLAAAQVHTIYISVAHVTGPGSAVTVPTSEQLAEDFVDQLDSYWSAETNNAVTLTLAVGGFEERTTNAACNTDALFEDAEANAFGGAFDSSVKWAGSYKHLITLTDKPCAGGLGTLGGNGGLIISGSGSGDSMGVPVALHEFGHNLGFAHANAAICATSSFDASDEDFGTPAVSDACNTEEYGDYLDIMGYSVANSRPHLSSPQKLAMGWLSGGLPAITASTTATIQALGESTGARALKIVNPIGGEIYYVEYRVPEPSSDGSSLEFSEPTTCETGALALEPYERCWGTTEAAGGVRILRALPDQGEHPGTSVLAVGSIAGEPSLTKRDTHLDAGEFFTNYDGHIRITVNSVSAEHGAEIAVEIGNFSVVNTSTTVSLSSDTAQYGGTAVAATAEVTPSSATGTIEFLKDSETTPFATSPVAGGSASTSVPKTLTAGGHTITARFVSASTAFNSSLKSEPKTVTFTVPATVKLAAASNAGGPGIRVSATVTLADGSAPSGPVQFSEGGSVYGSAPVNGGVATLSIPNITEGNHALTATYKPSKPHYLEGSVSATVTVTEFVEEDDAEDEPAPIVKSATKVTVKFTSLKVKLAKKAVVTVTVSGSRPTGKITVLSKGKKIATFTLKASSKGKAKITLPKFKKAGSYKITVSYGGSDLFKSSTSKATTLKIVK